jgi:hypothetical protein
VQYLEVNVAGEVSVPLRFFHAVREIVWVLQLNENAAANRHLHFNSATSDDAPRRHLLQEARLLVNGHERVPWMDAAYFYLVTNYEHHNDYSNLFAYLFSFATCPLKHQPTGSLNFSLLSDVTLQIRPDPRYVGPASPAKLKVWAVSQNELRVRSGMAGLRYAS